MKLNKIFSTVISVFIMGIFTMSPVLAGAPGSDEPEVPRVFAGTIEISSTQIAFLASAQTGGGTLEFEGMEHDFKIGGLGVGGIGIQSVNAVGVVYNMEKLSDLSAFSGDFNRSTQHFNLIAKRWSVEYDLQNSNKIYSKTER